jgi:exosome complex RNA-binding protein Rrp4
VHPKKNKSTNFSLYQTLKELTAVATLLQRNGVIVVFFLLWNTGKLDIIIVINIVLFSCALDLHTSDITRGNLELLKETVLCDLTLWNTHTYLFRKRRKDSEKK